MTCDHINVEWSRGEYEYHPRDSQVTITQECPDCGATMQRVFSYTGTWKVD